MHYIFAVVPISLEPGREEKVLVLILLGAVVFLVWAVFITRNLAKKGEDVWPPGAVLLGSAYVLAGVTLVITRGLAITLTDIPFGLRVALVFFLPCAVALIARARRNVPKQPLLRWPNSEVFLAALRVTLKKSGLPEAFIADQLSDHESHLQQKMQDLLAGGLGHDHAWRRTLEEYGDPQFILRVHHYPVATHFFTQLWPSVMHVTISYVLMALALLPFLLLLFRFNYSCENLTITAIGEASFNVVAFTTSAEIGRIDPVGRGNVKNLEGGEVVPCNPIGWWDFRPTTRLLYLLGAPVAMGLIILLHLIEPPLLRQFPSWLALHAYRFWHHDRAP